MVSSVIHPQSYRVIKGKLFNNSYLCPVHKKWADYTNLYIIDNSAYAKRIPYFPCYGDYWFNICYKIRKIVNGKSKVNLNTTFPAISSEKFNSRIHWNSTANSIKIIIITIIVNNNLWNILTVSMVCTTHGAVNVVKQTV